MTSVRRRRAVKNPGKRVRRKVADKAKPSQKTLVIDSHLAPHWDRSKTLEENYRQTGLSNHLNGDIGKRITQKRLSEWNQKRIELVEQGKIGGFDSEDEIYQELETVFAKEEVDTEGKAISQIEKQVAAAMPVPEPPKPKPLSEYELAYITRLVAKHGNNYDRMFMDIKLNDRQLTAYQLEKLAARLPTRN